MEITINDRIRKRKVQFFDKFKLDLRHDSVASSFAFAGYFNPDNLQQKEMYCVSHFHEVNVDHNQQRLLTGYAISEGFANSEQRDMAQIAGYSRPGFLNDCQIPAEAYPLQCDGLSLKEIASKFVEPFGVKVIVHKAVEDVMNESFSKTTAEAQQTVAAYLIELAQQKGVVVSHDVYGNLVFTKAATGSKPILDFDITKKGAQSIPFTKMSLSFNGQGMHSHIKVIKQQSANGGNAGESEIRNPYVPYVYRPHVSVQSSGTDNDTETAAKMILAAELKNLKVMITTDSWQVNAKQIIIPNTNITVLNPEIYIYKKTKLFVEEVSYEGDSKALTATLTCCLPEVYSLETPKYIFEGINQH